VERKYDNTLVNGAGESIGKAALHITANFTLHNHPTGDPAPSSEDIAVTRRLKEAGEIMGIKVLDHIIVGDGEYLSFVERGLL
jgi:DNA repair protein RadC